MERGADYRYLDLRHMRSVSDVTQNQVGDVSDIVDKAQRLDLLSHSPLSSRPVAPDESLVVSVLTVANPKALRPHIFRLLGPKTIITQGCWAVLSLRGRVWICGSQPGNSIAGGSDMRDFVCVGSSQALALLQMC